MLYYQPSWSARYERLGAVAATSTGTTATASATVNTVKGAWASLGTTGFDYQMLFVDIANASAQADYLVDIGVDDGAGNKFVLVPDLHLTSTRNLSSGAISYPLPLRVPKGTALYARCTASIASATLTVLLRGSAAGIGGAPGFARCLELFTPSTSRGQTITMGASNVLGVYNVMSTGVAAQIGCLMAFLGDNASVSRGTQSQYIELAVGATGSEGLLVPSVMHGFDLASDMCYPRLEGPWPVLIPPSTQIQVRGQGANATASNLVIDLCLWGFA